MKSLFASFTLLAAFSLVGCGGQEDPEKEKRYTDSLANVRYEERVTWIKDSLDQTCQERVQTVQNEIDSLNNLISARTK